MPAPNPEGPPRHLRGPLADYAAVIERAAGDLALAEEPARFLAALEAGAPEPEAGSPERSGD